ncbi:uncharacterized protein LOC134234330 [Saccostrea cucullata]|uniref:uncharacterized protein LOC134234330 n=1 Tax=Saccostrea cuccullata TaxID=36930 RepID=UPI002ED2000D
MDKTYPRNCTSKEHLNSSMHVKHNNIEATYTGLAIGILDLLVNGAVFVILMKDKNVRKNPYLFLVLMLCVSDFTVGLGIICALPSFIQPPLIRSTLFTVLQIVMMLNGLCLSLLQTFLISLQRYLVLCKERWNLFIFQHNRKYYVCIGSSFAVTLMNFVLISPPQRELDVLNDSALSFVYHGHYLAHSIYIKFLSLSLLSLTLILYSVTVRHVLKTYNKVNPIGNNMSINVRTIQVQMKPLHTIPRTTSDRNTNCHKNVQSRSRRHLLSLRQRKVVSSLKLVGVLIILLLICTGPFIFVVWNDSASSNVNRVLISLCILNSLINPFIYLWKLYDIKGIIKSRICFVRR